MGLALEHFFCCLDLSLGGIIMGWWGMIISAISIISLVLSVLLGGTHYYNDFFHIGTGGSYTGIAIMIILLIVYLYFSYQLLLGTQSGNSSQMVGYLIIHGILVVIFIIGVFKNASSLLGAALYVYLWICIYSLYVKSGGNAII